MEHWQIKDDNLTSIIDINERMESIRRRVDKMESTETRSNHIEALRKKHAAISKLNARLDALHIRRAAMLKKVNK